MKLAKPRLAISQSLYRARYVYRLGEKRMGRTRYRVLQAALAAAILLVALLPSMIDLARPTAAYADDFLKFHWKFDEGTSSAAADSSGNTPSYPGTLYNNPTWLVGGGLSFDGINDYARTNSPIPNSMGVPDQAYTLSASVRIPSGETNGNIIHISNGANGIGWCISMLHLEDGKFRAIGWQSGQPVTAIAPTVANNDEWYSIANTWSPETDELRLFVNGVLVSATPMSSYNAANADVYVFAGIDPGGCNNNHGWFRGDIKDVRIYSRAITQEEAEENSNESLPPSVVAFNPADDAIDAPIDGNFGIEFTADVEAGDGDIRLYKAEDDELLETIPADDAQVLIDGVDVSIDPEDDLACGTDYYVQIDNDAFKKAGTEDYYVGINDETTWNFTAAACRYTVSFDEQGGEAVSDIEDEAAGGVVTLPEAPVRLGGYTFLGWNTAADGSETLYEAGDDFTVPGDNVTLYAIWGTPPPPPSDDDDEEPAADNDNDGISNATEDSGPNGGDANNDGILDSTQSTVTSFVNQHTGKRVVLALSGCITHELSMLLPGALAQKDAGFGYPEGLMDFTIYCATSCSNEDYDDYGPSNGLFCWRYNSTVQITQYYFGTAPNDLVLRKYYPKTHAYNTITAATITAGELVGQAFTKVSYQIVEGGPLDDDGVANGIITDPVGLGQAVVGAPKSGLSSDKHILALFAPRSKS